ncbi:CDK5 and ABL1 enzyme substrate 1 [Sarcoptes scabiei]|nr:CDK5 and ABL1 enzyme substrate 1 [Sarcoptes scabiei]
MDTNSSGSLKEFAFKTISNEKLATKFNDFTKSIDANPIRIESIQTHRFVIFIRLFALLMNNADFGGCGGGDDDIDHHIIHFTIVSVFWIKHTRTKKHGFREKNK